MHTPTYKRRAPRLARAIALIFALALIAAACGSDDPAESVSAAAADSAPADSAPADSDPADEAMDDEVMADEIMSEDETMADDEVMEEEVMEEETMADEAMTDETMSEDEAMDNEVMADDEAMTDETMDDEAMTDETMTDEAMAEAAHTITVTIENISAGADTPTPLAPGVWVVHEESASLFTLGSADAGNGLEALAEDGNAADLAGFLPGTTGVHYTDAFSIPDGADEPGPVLPGSSYSFTASVSSGLNLSFATMFVQSNDWVFATPESGLNLFDVDGNLVEGDISDQLLLIDVGTEIDQAPGSGADQAPRQAAPNTGAVDADNTVRVVEGRTASDYVKVTVTAG